MTFDPKELLPCPFCGGAPDDQITRLKDAIEGECHGLVISDEQARAILDYVLGARPNFVAPDELADIPDYDAGLLPSIPDDDSDFTPELARKIIAKYQELIRKLEAERRSTPTPTVPEGWVMVPREPTREMAIAAAKALDDVTVDDPKATAWDAMRAYRAMLSAAPTPPVHEKVITEIAAERKRQIEEEGFTPEHDDRHTRDELAKAAAAYALGATTLGWQAWPWPSDDFKPKDRRRDLIRACALLVAEIERLDRATREKGMLYDPQA